MKLASAPLRSLMCASLLLATAPVPADSLRVGGTGSAAPIVRLLFEAYQVGSSADSLDLIDPPLGTSGAVRALAAGRIDLGMAGRVLKPDEGRDLGESWVVADTPFALGTRDGQRPQGFALADLAEVYAGRLERWDDGKPIRLVLRASTESDTLTLRALSPAMDQAVQEAARRPGMQMGDNDLDTLQLLVQTPGSLGPTTLGLVASAGAKLRLLPLEGQAPTLANLRDGRYPWSKGLVLVLPKEPSPAARRFAEFLRSAAARGLLEANGYLPRDP